MTDKNNITDYVLCGDSLDIIKEYGDKSIDLIVTDPPYGISYKSNKQNCDTRGNKTIIKDRKDYFEKIVGDDHLSIKWLEDAYRVLKDNSALYIFCHWSKWNALYEGVEKAGFKVKNMIVLNKSNHGSGDLKGQYAPRHELILFATKGRHILNFPKKRIDDIWNVPVKFSGSKRLHPNEKPLSWITPCLENSSKVGDLVLDPFAGSGSVGMSCKNLQRKYIMIDIDKKYCDIMIERLK